MSDYRTKPRKELEPMPKAKTLATREQYPETQRLGNENWNVWHCTRLTQHQ